jgi:hypothetical protein
VTRIVALAALLAALGGCGGGGGISGSAVAECLNTTGREALFDDNEFLLFGTVRVRTPDNRAFFDEVDAVFSKKAQERGHRDDLRALLNSGYRRGQVVLRMGGGNRTTLQAFEVFGAKALAGLGSLPPTLPAIRARSGRGASAPRSRRSPGLVAGYASVISRARTRTRIR